MKTTVEIPAHIARAVLRRQAQVNCSARFLPGSLARARDAENALASGPAENLPRTLSATRGARRAGAMIPRNMAAAIAASEEKAWSHSELAGVLWEHGFRASIACQLAETADQK